MEIWKDIYFEENGVIYDYREIYQVSNLGRVKSLNYKGTGQKRILKVWHNKKGYLCIKLHKNGTIKNFKVHRLVAQAFIPNPLGLPCVDHINCVRDDNRINNLRWVTHKNNCNNPLTRQRNSEAQKGKRKRRLY